MSTPEAATTPQPLPAPKPKRTRQQRGRAKPAPTPPLPITPVASAPPEHACPDWLDPRAKAMFEQMVKDLDELRMLALTDTNALVRYCDAWIRWIDSARFISEHGETYALKDDAGNIRCLMPFPSVAQYHQLGMMLLRLEQELGLTPSGRTRIRVTAAGIRGGGGGLGPIPTIPCLPETPEARRKRLFFEGYPVGPGGPMR